MPDIEFLATEDEPPPAPRGRRAPWLALVVVIVVAAAIAVAVTRPSQDPQATPTSTSTPTSSPSVAPSTALAAIPSGPPVVEVNPGVAGCGVQIFCAVGYDVPAALDAAVRRQIGQVRSIAVQTDYRSAVPTGALYVLDRRVVVAAAHASVVITVRRQDGSAPARADVARGVDVVRLSAGAFDVEVLSYPVAGATTSAAALRRLALDPALGAK